MTALAIVTLSLGYALPGVFCGRLVAGHLAWSWAETKYSHRAVPPKPNGDQWSGAALVGLLCVFIWPALVVAHAFPAERFAVGAEARAISRQREQRIRELEKELDLR